MKKKQQPFIANNNKDDGPYEQPGSATASGTIAVTHEPVRSLDYELQLHHPEPNEELKRAYSELEVLAAKYRDLYDFAPVGYLTIDGGERILEANLECAALLGIGRRELIHKLFSDFLAVSSRDSYAELRSKTIEPGVHKSCELVIRRAEGSETTVQAEVISAGTNGDMANQMRVALLDISARKLAENTVQEHFDVLARKLGFLTGELDVDRFLRQTLVVLTEQDHAQHAAFWFADSAGEMITLHSINNGRQVMTGSQSGHTLASVPLPLKSLSFWTEMRRSRRPLIVQDEGMCPELSMVQSRDDIKSERTMLLVPLLLGQYVLGLAVLESLGRRNYRQEEIVFAQAVAQQVTIAVQMARLGDQARHAAVLQERNRMAQEIHDTLAQGFTVILMQLEVAQDSMSDAPAEAHLHLERARDMARASLAAARRSVRALQPRELEQHGLPGALAELATRTSRDSAIRPVLDIHGLARPLHEEIETNLLRIAQESIYNIQKHAEAIRIWIELSFEPNTIRLAVRDDGKGFDATAMRSTNHYGLQVMRERAEAIGGVFQLSSRPGHGTQIMVTAPFRAPGDWEV